APALFTRMPTGPKSAATLSANAAHAAASRTSSTRPPPLALPCARRLEMPSAPLSEVDVPTTTAPAFARASAIASPMPREAPVTIATCPFSIASTLRGRFERGAILEGHALHARHDPLHEAG